jgi:hypothetical protein
MSETEDAAITVARLLKTEMRVSKDDGSLATVTVTTEWQNTEAFKSCDGQVTVGLAESTDQKIELSGKTRRRLSFLRVNVWVTDAPRATEAGRIMRGKIVEEVNRVIRQNRASPNETCYDFYNTGVVSQTHRAFRGKDDASPYAAQDWTELSNEDYVKLWASDDNHVDISCGSDGEYASVLFGFKVESRRNAAKKVVLSFEGVGTAPNGNGITVKIWNNTSLAWEHEHSEGGSGSNDKTVTITLIQDLPSYFDEKGCVWFLARTRYASDGVTPALLSCDYACCVVTVNGIAYCDVAGFRNLDRTDVKPFIYRTEFTVKSWFFENIGV